MKKIAQNPINENTCFNETCVVHEWKWNFSWRMKWRLNVWNIIKFSIRKYTCITNNLSKIHEQRKKSRPRYKNSLTYGFFVSMMKRWRIFQIQKWWIVLFVIIVQLVLWFSTNKQRPWKVWCHISNGAQMCLIMGT